MNGLTGCITCSLLSLLSSEDTFLNCMSILKITNEEMSNSNRQYNNTGEKGGGRGDWKAQAAAAVPRKAMKTNGFLLFTMTRKRQMGSSEASRSMSTEMAIKMFDNEWKVSFITNFTE
jgi:hypothetical protein